MLENNAFGLKDHDDRKESGVANNVRWRASGTNTGQSQLMESASVPGSTIAIKPIRQKTVVEAQMTGPSKANVFMQSHPGGPLETIGREMRIMERQVSSQLQKKGTTLVQGRDSLEAIAKNVASENKENEPVTASVSKRKRQDEVLVVKTTNKKGHSIDVRKAKKKQKW
jgi:hypothetical protein